MSVHLDWRWVTYGSNFNDLRLEPQYRSALGQPGSRAFYGTQLNCTLDIHSEVLLQAT
jgi:hypothetical protein